MTPRSGRSGLGGGTEVRNVTERGQITKGNSTLEIRELGTLCRVQRGMERGLRGESPLPGASRALCRSPPSSPPSGSAPYITLYCIAIGHRRVRSPLTTDTRQCTDHTHLTQSRSHDTLDYMWGCRCGVWGMPMRCARLASRVARGCETPRSGVYT